MKTILPGISALAVVVGLALVGTPSTRAEQGTIREFAVRGDNFTFAPSRIEVQRDDIVKVTFTAVDMAHSFTADAYRIAKRANAGQTVTFEFRATGSARFYCNLALDERCKNMHGEIVVR